MKPVPIDHHLDKKSILSKVPTFYSHLTNERQGPAQEDEDNLVRPAVHPQRYFPSLLSPRRVRLAFSCSPFPHLEHVVDDPVPDTHLTRAQKESERRREAYPKTGASRLWEGDIPDILDPAYPQYRLQVEKRVSAQRPILLPLPSMLHKPIGKEEYISKIRAFDSRASGPSSSNCSPSRHTRSASSDINLGTTEEDVYFQHVRQPDFSDFEQNLMIQKPMVIYLQQKPTRNPMQHYTTKRVNQ